MIKLLEFDLNLTLGFKLGSSNEGILVQGNYDQRVHVNQYMYSFLIGSCDIDARGHSQLMKTKCA